MEQTVIIGGIGITFQFQDPRFQDAFQSFTPFLTDTSGAISITLTPREEWPEYQEGKTLIGTDMINASIEKNDLKFRSAGVSGVFNFEKMRGNFDAYPFKSSIDFIIRAIIIYGAPFFDAFLIHSSAVYNDHSGIVGTGISGAGKTTLAKTLAQFNYTILHDDANLIRKIDGVFYLFPTPIKTFNVTATHPLKPSPLTHLFFLGKTEENSLINLSQNEIITRLLRMVFAYSPLSPKHYTALITLFYDLIESITIKQLNYNPKTLQPDHFL